jgi:hypothetical protein
VKGRKEVINLKRHLYIRLNTAGNERKHVREKKVEKQRKREKKRKGMCLL